MRTRFSLALLLIPFALFATEEESNGLQDLTHELTEITQTATVQRANIDYLPFIMSVFEGDELSHAGANSLKDALSLVAGVNISTDNVSLFNPIIRGSNSSAYGQSKLIIDGIEVNDLNFDGYSAYLSMPIDLIKRIEVVRGPGGYSDGHWGYAGSIVVTTYKKEPSADQSGRWFASAGSYGSSQVGGAYNVTRDDFAFGIDVYTLHNTLALNYGKDGLANNIFGAINAPLSQSGSAPLGTDTTVLSATLSKGSFFADGRFSLYRHGAGGGMNYALASNEDHYNVNQSSFRLGSHYNIGEFSGTLQGSMIQDHFGSYGLVAPQGIVLRSITAPFLPITYPNGFYSVNETMIRTYWVSNTLTGIIGGGEGTFGIKKSRSSLIEETTINTDRSTGVGLVDYSATRPFMEPHSAMNDFSAYLTYEHPLSRSWMGYFSLTLNKHNQLAPRWDPRIATIYTINPDNVLKFSVSRAHRNPSWQEMFTLNNSARWGNPDLKAESVMAYETQFIHNFGLNHTLSMNLFQLKNENQIFLQQDPTTHISSYVNGLNSTITGFETEWRKRYDTLSFYTTYTRIIGHANGATLPDAPMHTVSGFVTYNWDQNWYTSLSGRWQSKITRYSLDPRPSMQEVSTMDGTVGYTLPQLHSEIQFSVKNMFNQTQLYPSPINTYSSDYPGMGRTYLITLRGTF
ncbi:MAG: TonB-dependent receptor plug domain-containing protein [Sulfuricurvum sp.]